jgi:large subunit ribosomal protein L30
MAAKKEKTESAGPTIRIQYYRSAIGYSSNQKAVVASMGFKKLNQILEKSDNSAMRGTVKKVPHLLRIID